MDGFEKFETFVVSSMNGRFRPLLVEALETKIRKDVTTGSVPFWRKFQAGFFEIHTSLETLRLNEKLISLPPPVDSEIQANQYLNYHISAYFHEVYILKNRLEC